MRIAVCGLGCKSTFEITEDNEDGAICHVLTLDPKEDKGYREVMTFGCDLCQKSAEERKDILETSAVAVTIGMERDRYKGELEEETQLRTDQFTELTQANVDVVRLERELRTAKDAHEATLENYRTAVGHLDTAENELIAQKEAHDEVQAELDQKEHEE